MYDYDYDELGLDPVDYADYEEDEVCLCRECRPDLWDDSEPELADWVESDFGLPTVEEMLEERRWADEVATDAYKAPHSNIAKLPTGWATLVTGYPYAVDDTRRYWSRRSKVSGRQRWHRLRDAGRRQTRRAQRAENWNQSSQVDDWVDTWSDLYGWDADPYSRVGYYQELVETDWCNIPNADDRELWRRQDGLA